MLYRNHREYDAQPGNQYHELLRSWLRGESGPEVLKIWLRAMYN